MVNPNKRVKRPSGLGEVFKYKTDEEENILTLPIMPLLKDNYIYLYRSINDEDFYIAEDATCFFFKEIVYDNEVVGFATYRTSSFEQNALVLQHIYVLPEFRGNHLLQEELDEATLLFESSIIIESPNRYIIESLLKHRLARVFEDRFVISRIPFIVPLVSQQEVMEGTYLEDYDLSKTNGRSKVSLIYDLELCSVVGLAQDNEDKDYNDEVETEDISNYNNMSLAYKVDDKDFDCIVKRNNDEWLKDGTYYEHVRKLVEENDEIIQNWLSIV